MHRLEIITQQNNAEISNLLQADIGLESIEKGLKRTDSALASFKKATEESATNVDAYENLGVFLFDLGRFDEAKKALKDALTLENGRERALYYLRRIDAKAKTTP